MTAPDGILATAKIVLLVDWPSRDVPDTLTHAGYTVHVKDGPAADDFSVHEVHDDSSWTGALASRLVTPTSSTLTDP
jgi:hypothetical protein